MASKYSDSAAACLPRPPQGSQPVAQPHQLAGCCGSGAAAGRKGLGAGAGAAHSAVPGHSWAAAAATTAAPAAAAAVDDWLHCCPQPLPCCWAAAAAVSARAQPATRVGSRAAVGSQQRAADGAAGNATRTAWPRRRDPEPPRALCKALSVCAGRYSRPGEQGRQLGQLVSVHAWAMADAIVWCSGSNSAPRGLLERDTLSASSDCAS